jgi:hypothetical protein
MLILCKMREVDAKNNHNRLPFGPGLRKLRNVDSLELFTIVLICGVCSRSLV